MTTWSRDAPAKFDTWPEEWIRDSARRWGVEVYEIAEGRSTVWSSLCRVVTDGPVMYFKASHVSTCDEVALTALLSERLPERVPEVVAADPGRAWLLMVDGGETMREQIERTGDAWSHWKSALRALAELQIETVEIRPNLVDAGVPLRASGSIPTDLAALLDEPELRELGAEEALTESELDEIRSRLDELEELETRMEACWLPPSLIHEDFHDGNVLVGDRRYRIFDWGEASVAHPLLSVATALKVASRHLGGDDEALEGLIASYLEPWSRTAPLGELRTALDPARSLANANRAIGWRRLLSNMPADERSKWEEAVPRWLRATFSLPPPRKA